MKIFQPKIHYKTVHDIDLYKLKLMGINNLIVDLDETLRKRNSGEVPEGSIKWVQGLKEKGFNVCITSNNPFPWQVKKIEALFKVPCTFFALKPFPIAFYQAMRTLKSKPSNTALIGDQLFTDIWGANILGIYSILVDPITGAEKGIFRRIIRWLEEKVFPRVNLEI
jgi:hypothetical protein